MVENGEVKDFIVTCIFLRIRTIAPEEDCPTDNYPPGQLPPG